MKLLIASNNPNKIKEIRNQIPSHIELVSLQDMGITEDIPETADTLEGNALLKAQYLHELKGVNCFSDDTGLEVEVLDGAPGVYSARYAGPQRDSEDNMNLLLESLEGEENRDARFRTVISLIFNDETHVFEGIAEGHIITKRKGDVGFGYDPIFQPVGYDMTFAEMSLEEKNAISHRGRAVKKLIDFLNTTTK